MFSIETVVWNAFLVLIGALALSKSSPFVVKHASKLARLLGVSSFVIGASLLAIGTNLPELASSAVAALNGDSSLVLGINVGSNLANIALLLPIAALFVAIKINRSTINRDVQLLFVTSAMLFWFSLDGKISQLEGTIWLGLLAIYLWYLFKIKPKKIKENTPSIELGLLENKKKHAKTKHFFFILVGIAIVIIAAQITATSAIQLAKELGVSSGLIGLTIIALATNLPELSLTLAALKSKNPTLLVGNLVGGNILRILLILGGIAAFQPLLVSGKEQALLLFYWIISSVFFLWIYWQQKLEKKWAIVFLVLYFLFLALAVSVP